MAKEIKLSARDQALIDSLGIGNINEIVSNPFTGKRVELEPQAVALYDFIKGCEYTRLYDKMQQGLNIFRRKWPNAYMTLLD